jgi:hypothetical protein
MIQSKLTTLATERSELELPLLSRDSIKWLEEKIKEIRRPTQVAKDISRERSRQTFRLLKGRMYCYYYNPIGKKDLPYYDIFPMVILLEKYEDGFLGLNLHYLPYRYRLAFLRKLVDYASFDNDDNVVKLRITYDILQSSRRFKEFRPCIKKYLYSQIRSKMLTIQPNEWEIASFLPVHQFKGEKPGRIWAESIQEIRKS